MPIRRLRPLACVLFATLLVYLNHFQNSFHFDDFHTITDNPAIRSLSNLRRIFTDVTAFSVLPANQTYRPIVTSSLALDYALARGYVPFWFHLSTFLCFLVLIALLFVFAEQVYSRTAESPAMWLALGVAAWFALHPVMAETVNYVIQRGDLYCTLGCLGALVVFAAAPRWRRYGLYLVPFVFAMLSKPPASVFPLLLFIFVYFFEEADRSGTGRLWASLTKCVPAVVATAMLLWLQSRMTPKTYAPSILSPAAYRLVQPYVWLRYFGALFLPLHLNVDTDLQPMQAVALATCAGFAFVLCLIAAIWYTARRRRLYPIAFGLLWFVITQLPTSVYTLSEVENDHRMFFSFPGLMIAVVSAGYLAYEGLQRHFAAEQRMLLILKRGTVGFCFLALCGYAFGARRRNAVWHDEQSLWADDVAKSPHNGRGLMIYGLTKMNSGDFRGALDLFDRALQFTPNYPTLEVNLGIVNGLLADSGNNATLAATAEAHFQRAIALAPEDDLTHAYYGRWLLAHGRLSDATRQLTTAVSLNGQRTMERDLLLDAYLRQGDSAAATALAKDTLLHIPQDSTALAVLQGKAQGERVSPAAALINTSLADYQAGKFSESIAVAQQAIKIDARSAEAWNNVGAGYGALHQWDLAIAAEAQALRINPSLEIAANNLRWFQAQKTSGMNTKEEQDAKQRADQLINLSLTLNQKKDYLGSIAAATKALSLEPKSPEAWNNIAAGREALGQWDLAIEAAQKAIALRPDFQLAKNNLQWSLMQKQSAQHRH